VNVLCVNVGSSTIKYSVYCGVEFELCDSDALESTDTEAMFAALNSKNIAVLDAIGHRIVHGGPRYFDPVRLTPEVRRDMEDAIHFAPLHLPQELKVIDSISARHASLFPRNIGIAASGVTASTDFPTSTSPANFAGDWADAQSSRIWAMAPAWLRFSMASRLIPRWD